MKAIVTTTINKPTEAIFKFSKLKDWRVYIVGDQKTPHEYYENEKDWIYLSPKYQNKKYKKISDFLGWNNIQRRNIGFIEAYLDGCSIVASVDDDNIPLQSWKNILVGESLKVKSYTNKNNLFDPLSVTSLNSYWHRGYPLQLVNERFENKCQEETIKKVQVQVGMWNGTPDIDAISKIMHGDQIFQKVQGDFPYSSKSTIFSSQNVLFDRSMLPNFAVLPFCGRMDDIWGGIFMQKRTGCSVVFTEPSTFHNRNPHDPVDDLGEEIIGIRNTLNFLDGGEKVLDSKILKFIDMYQKEMGV